MAKQNLPIGTPLPGPESEAPPPVVPNIQKLEQERNDAVREVDRLKAKFGKMDEELARHQTAIAELVAENDEQKRLAIRDRLKG